MSKYILSVFISFCFTLLSGQKVEPVIQLGHTDWVRFYTLSPNHKLLLTTSEDNTVKIWDMKAQVCISTFAQHKDVVLKAIFFKPKDVNDYLVASVSKDNTVCVFNPYSSELIYQFKTHKNEVSDIVFNEKQQLLFTKDKRNTIGWKPLNGEVKFNYESLRNQHTRLFSHPSLYANFEITGNGRRDVCVDKQITSYINRDEKYIQVGNNTKNEYHDYFLGKIKYHEKSQCLLYMLNNTRFYVDGLDDNSNYKTGMFSTALEDYKTDISYSKEQLIDANFGGKNELNGITSIGAYVFNLSTGKVTKNNLNGVVRDAKVNQNNQAVIRILSKHNKSERRSLIGVYDFELGQIVDTIVENATYSQSLSDLVQDSLVVFKIRGALKVYNINSKQIIFDRQVDQLGFPYILNQFLPEEYPYIPFSINIPKINGWDLSDLSYNMDSSDFGRDYWGDVEYKDNTERYFKSGEFQSYNFKKPKFYNQDSLVSLEYDSERLMYKTPQIQGGLWSSYDVNPYSRGLFISLYDLESFNTTCFLDNSSALCTGLGNEVQYVSWKENKKFNKPYNKGGLVGVGSPYIFNKNTYWKGHEDLVTSVALSADKTMAASTSFDNQVIIWDVKTGKIKHRLKGHLNNSNLAVFIDNDTRLITFGRDLNTKIWDVESGKLIVTLITKEIPKLGKYYNMAITPDNYYSGSPELVHDLIFKMKKKIYSFEQFDLKYNRPDIVLERLGYADSLLVMAYKKAYIKRLHKLGFTEDMLKDDINIPNLKIQNIEEIPSVIDKDSLKLRLNMNDEIYPLDRINIWVNDVPVFGQNGISVKSKKAKNLEKEVTLNLMNGNNKIQVSVMNTAGIESLKETINIKCKNKKTTKNLYLITIGVSEFENTTYNLKYAAKDAKDVSGLFKKDSLYNDVYTKTLINEQVNNQNIHDLKNFLSSAEINDHVIIFLAGHGVLDQNLDYYFASHDMNFNNPSQKGIDYTLLESLLDGIKPIHKMMFIDACHSGEIDKESTLLANNNTIIKGKVNFRAVGDKPQPKLGLNNIYELSKSLFSDLRKGTGATVISSAGGMEFAFEGEKWNNGLFTYVLMNGIITKKADLNKDGEIWLSELQQFLSSEVSKLSNGNQKPNSRKQNLTLNFRIW